MLSLLWTFGIWLTKCSIVPQTTPIRPKIYLHTGDLLHRTTSSKRTKNQTKAPTTHDSSDLFHVDNAPSNAEFSRSNAFLYMFEDNEAEIKMIIKGRSPTMRHVSRTHRVALDWLFDRINLDSKIQIKYIDTKHQIAETLTTGNFTRDAWSNLLHLFNISHFSSLCCAKNFSLVSWYTMAKRMEEQKRRKQGCGEIQADGDEPGHFCSYKFFICERSDCIEKPGDAQSFKSDWILRETWLRIKTKVQSRRSVEFSRMGCSNCSYARGGTFQKIRKLQKIQKMRNSEVEFGHIISVYHWIMLITSGKSSRS